MTENRLNRKDLKKRLIKHPLYNFFLIVVGGFLFLGGTDQFNGTDQSTRLGPIAWQIIGTALIIGGLLNLAVFLFNHLTKKKNEDDLFN